MGLKTFLLTFMLYVADVSRLRIKCLYSKAESISCDISVIEGIG